MSLVLLQVYLTLIVLVVIKSAYCFNWINIEDKSQGFFALSVGSELDFVSDNGQENIHVKLLKVDLDHFIDEQYRFFVPKIEPVTCQHLLPQDENREVRSCDMFFEENAKSFEHVINFDAWTSGCLSCCSAKIVTSTKDFYAMHISRQRPRTIATFQLINSKTGSCFISTQSLVMP